MKTKVSAAVLLTIMCICFLAVEGGSQPMPHAPGSPPINPFTPVVVPPPSPSAPQEGSLEQLVQQLKNVRRQQDQLKTQEAELLGRIAQKVEEQRKALQKAEELLRELQQPKGDRATKDLPTKAERKDVFEDRRKEEKK